MITPIPAETALVIVQMPANWSPSTIASEQVRIDEYRAAHGIATPIVLVAGALAPPVT